jgi:predicted phage terminase large subunit-like protein
VSSDDIFPSSPEFTPADLRAFEAALERFEPAVPRWATPGDLARAIDPKTVQTEALDAIDEALVWAYSTPEARLIISMPPQEGKSQRVTKTGVLWALLQKPDLRFGIVSYAQELAEGFAREIRDWITNNNGDEGSLDLGVRIQRDNGAARRWKLAGHKGGVNAVGIGSGLTGRPIDALIIDDPFKDSEQADSLYFRDRVWNWWQSTGSTRLAPGAPVIVILTRWHEDDLAGRLIAAEDGAQWRVINIPALADHNPAKGQTDPLGREPGTWLQSARRRTTKQWQAIRVRVGTRVFNALYQGRPSPETGDVWKRGWWRRYDTPLWSDAGDGRSNTVHGMDEVIMSWDMTFKDTKSSDFVVGQVWARKGADIYLLDQIHKRLSFTDTLSAFEALVKKWPQATTKLVEDKANGTAVIDTFRKKIPGIVPINPTESKYARANAVAPFIEAGNVHLPSGEAALFDVESLIEEAAGFPNAAHDDQVDATSQAINRLLLRVGQGSAFLQAMKARAAADGIEVPTTTRNWRDNVPKKPRPEGATNDEPGRRPR